MSEFWNNPLAQFAKLTWVSVVDILVVAILIYQVFAIIRGRRSAHILVGLGILIVVYALAAALGFELLASILSFLAPFTPIALIVMFQSELRRLLARLGRRREWTLSSRLEKREFAEEILLAIKALSAASTGALIVIERDIGLRTFIESGVALDAVISRDLLISIFQNKGPLHDGAVVVQGNRITAAACFLPLSMNPNVVARKLGTRHRAAIGITEETDCLCLVVSEETGAVSVAANGEIEINCSRARVDARIATHFGRRKTMRDDIDDEPAAAAPRTLPAAESKPAAATTTPLAPAQPAGGGWEQVKDA